MKKLYPFLLAAVFGALAGYSFFLYIRHEPLAVQNIPQSGSQATPTPSPSASSTLSDVASSSSSVHILEYHHIRMAADSLSVSPTNFAAQISALKNAGYSSETMADFAAGKGNNKTVVLTFEGGYADFYTNAYPILQKNGWTATVYVVSNQIGGVYLTWTELKAMENQGFEVGSASLSGINLSTASATRVATEVTKSQTTLTKNIGVSIVSFSYPYGAYTPAVTSAVQIAGYTSAVTTTVGSVTHGSSLFSLSRLPVYATTTTALLLAELKP